jgi:hypothetical protein
MVNVLVVCAAAAAAAAPTSSEQIGCLLEPSSYQLLHLLATSSRTVVTTFVSIVPIVRCIPPILLSIV